MNGRKPTNQAGFTLVELLVVTSLSVLLMITATSLFMTFFISGAKGSSQQQIKNEGEQALARMEFLIRNAVELVPNNPEDLTPPTCTTNMSSIGVRSRDGRVAYLRSLPDPANVNVSKIASSSGIPEIKDAFLTSSSVTIPTDKPLRFDCTRSGPSTLVTIRFGLRKGTPGVNVPIDIVSQDFERRVIVRSF